MATRSGCGSVTRGTAASGSATLPGALTRAEPLLSDWFIVTYGDGYPQADYRAAAEAFQESMAQAMMLVQRNTDPEHANDIRIEDGMVIAFGKAHAGPAFGFLIYGVTFMRRGALSVIGAGAPCTEDEFYGALIARRWLRG